MTINQDLISIFGVNKIVKTSDIINYSKDMGDYEANPFAVIRADNENDIIKTVNYAKQHSIPIVVWGAGSSLTGAVVLDNSLVLDLSKMTKIIKIDPINWYVHVQPGITLEDLNEELKKYNFFFPPDPASSSICTVCGAIAEGSGGMKCVKYGTVKDWVISLKVVLANGKSVSLGEPLAKNRAGYDLVHLMVGSEGTLGIITEAWLKIIPIPTYETVLMQIFFNNLKYAQNTIQNIRKSLILPSMIEFMDKDVIQAINAVTDLNLPDSEALIIMEIEKNSLNKITEICESSGSSKIILPETEEEADQLYSARATAYLAVRQLASGIHIEDVVVPIDKLSDYLLTVKNIASKYNLTIPLLGHAGDGNVHPNILYDKSDPVSVENASHAFEDICKYAIDVGGSITGEHGIGIQKMKLFKDQILSHNGDDVLYLMKSIKKLFDPQGLFNPGKYVEVED